MDEKTVGKPQNPEKSFVGGGDQSSFDSLTSIVGWRDGKTLENQWVNEHLGVSRVLEEFLRMVPTDEIEGRVYGSVVQTLSCRREALEKGLKELGTVEGSRALRLCAINKEKEPENEPNCEPPDVLQTVTMSLSDVRKDLRSWIPAMRAEYNSLTCETEAVLPVDVSSLDPQKVEFVPGKLVCVVKAGPKGGKKKCRGVICGNMMESDPSPIGVYASGADGTLIRTVIRHAALMKWGCSTTDIKTAFLLAPRVAAPQQREVVVIPPRILVEAGVCSANERWKILKALYGLPSSPACWAKFRDETMTTFVWESEVGRVGLHQTPESNLWKIVQLDGSEAGKMVGQVLVYVDDLMVLGPPEIRNGFLKRLGSEWTCAPVEHVEKGKWTRFSGLELSLDEDGTSMKLSQISYIKELLQRHDDVNEKSTPMPKWDTEGTPEEDITPQQIREAQMITGELLWASVRTRPDVAFAVSIMGQQVTKRQKWVCQLGKQVLGFLKSTWDHCLVYPSEVGGHGHDGSLQIPRHCDLLEAHTDISFAPNGNRSYQGILVFFAGAPVQWEANRQSFHTLSTSESELMAAIEGMTMTQSVEALLKVMYDDKVHEKVLYGNNASTISIIERPDGPWRTRHLRLRANCLKERLREQPEQWKLRHQKGSLLVADLLTKPVTQIATWRRFWKALNFSVSARHEDGLNDEKGNTYEKEEKDLNFIAATGKHGDQENSEESKISQEAVVKIAKVGMLLGLVEKIPWNPEHGTVKAVLFVVFTILLSFFVWKWKNSEESSVGDNFEGCKKLRVSASSTVKESEKKTLVKKWQEKMVKRVRENEPTPQVRENEPTPWVRENEPTLWVRENEPTSKQGMNYLQEMIGALNFGMVRGTPKDKGEKDAAKVFRRDIVAGQKFCFSCGELLKETVNRNPLSISDGSSYHCPQGCPGCEGSEGARAMADLTTTPKLAAVRLGRRGDRVSGDLPQELPELWEERKFEETPKYNKDEWLDCWLEQGWLVRSHGKQRVRRFHPVHKGNPIHVDNLDGERVTIGFNNMGEKVTVKDRWTDAPTNHFCPKQPWKGWTFLRLKQPMRSNLGERFAGALGQSGSGAAASTFGGAGERSSSFGQAVSELPSYATVSGPSPFPEKSGHSKNDESFLPVVNRGYNQGTTIKNGQLVANQVCKTPDLEDESDEDWEKVSEAP